MNNMLIKRGRISLLICCTVAISATAVAQTTNYYYSGGTGSLSTSSTAWWSAINTNQNPHTVTGNSTPWVNDINNSVANIGYVSSAGSGGTNATGAYQGINVPFLTGGTSGTNNDTQGRRITLDPANAISANGIVFSYDSSNGTVEANSRYSLMGGTVNLGNGGLTIDLSNTAGYTTYSFGSSVYSSINCMNASSGGTLNVNVNAPNITNGTSYTASYIYLSGTNSYTTLHVGAVAGSANGAVNEAVIQAPSAAGSYSGSSGSIQNVILDNNAGLAYMGTNTSTLVVGNVLLNGPATTKSITYGAYSTTRARIFGGDYSTTGFSEPSLQVGSITGNGDLIFATGASNNGRASLLLTSTCQYSGDTFIQSSSMRGPGADVGGMAYVTLGVDNALPTGTNLIWGLYQSAGNGGCFDLGGHNQQVASIGTIGINVGSTQNDYFGGLTNSNSNAAGTMTLLNSSTNNWVESQFHGVIGRNYMDTTSQRQTATYDNLRLVLAAGNNASLTLGLANQGSSPPGVPLTESNTYNGGTVVKGGMLFASNGNTYWDGQHGTQNNGYGLAYGVAVTGVTLSASNENTLNSATGTGPVTVNNGGTIGGSRLGGAIGMPTTGPVTINTGGALLPGGGYFVDASGAVAGGYVGVSTPFTPTSGPAFHVLGNLILNANSTVNFNFDSYNADQINVGGVLAQATSASGQIDLNLNDLGTLANGLTLFTFSNTGSMPANLSPIGPGSFLLSETGGNAAWSYSLLENSNSTALTLQITSSNAGFPVRNDLTWSGTNSAGLWNTSIANFTLSGSTKTFNNGDIVSFDNSGGSTTVNIAAAGVQPNGMVFTNQGSNYAYTVTGGSIGGGAFISVTNGGMVTLADSGNAYVGNTYLASASTLQANFATSISPSSVVTITDLSQLLLNFSSGTLANTIHLNPGAKGPGARPTISVPNGQVVVTGALLSDSIGVNAAGLTKMGGGTLTLTNAAQSNDTGSTYIGQGAIRVTTTTTGIPGQSYDALGSGNMYTGYNGAYTGAGTLWLDNVNVGVRQNNTIGRALGFFDMYPGSGIKGTGNSSLSYQAIALILSQSTGSVYQQSNCYFTTASPSDTLTLNNNVQQFDPNSGVGHYNNGASTSGSSGVVSTAVANTSTNAYGMQTTIHVAGGGKVVLADGANTNASSTFGGVWSVESGVLQVGPFQFNPNFNSDPNSASYGNGGVWNGPTGEPFTALGFMVPKTNSTSYYGNPDMPTTATMNTGGVLAIAVDQLNPLDPTLAPGYYTSNFNATPAYVRTSVVLAGGSVASTGYEATFLQQSSGTQAAITSANSPVVARFGGNFTVSNSGGSVLTYDPNGQAKDSWGNAIASDNGSRTVELTGGLRYLAGQSWGYAAGTTVSFSTNWNGPLTVASSGTTGGTLNIKRSGGYVTVTSSASIAIQPYSTVNISNDDTSNMTVSLSGSNYGQMYLPAGGTLPVMNYVLSNGATAGGLAVPIANNGTFNVKAGLQAVASISGTGSTNVNGTASLTVNSGGIVQNSASVASGATLNLAGSGAVASNLVLANAGNLNVTGGSHAVNTVGTLTLDASGNQTLPTTGTTTVTGAGITLSAGQIYQNAININNGASVVLTGPNLNTAPYTLSAASSLNIDSNPASKLDVNKSGIYLPSSSNAAIVSQITQGAGPIRTTSGVSVRQWNGTGGITSSAAASNPSRYAVGYFDLGNGLTEVAYTVAGDANLVGGVDSSDRKFVAASKYTSVGTSWQTGDFNYDGQVDSKDRAIELKNEGVVLSSNAQGTPLGDNPLALPGDAGVPLVAYNQATGVLTLDNSGPYSFSNLDSFGIQLKDASGLPKLFAVSDWAANVFSNNPSNESLQWSQQNAGGSDVLPAGEYTLAVLPTGLTDADFGNATYGTAGNTTGSVFFIDAHGNETDSSVMEVVPEPSSLALCAAAGLTLAAGLWRRRRKHASASDQAAS